MKRPIDPHVLAVRNGSWLVVAYCRRRKAMRDFSVAGITRAELCDPLTDHTAIFTPQTGFNLDSYFRKRFSALDSGELCTARLLVEPDRAVYFRRKKYHPSQVIEGEGEDGRIVVSFTVSGLEEIRSFAQGWGTGVTVVEPEELIERMGEEARELAERYGARHGNDINS